MRRSVVSSLSIMAALAVMSFVAAPASANCKVPQTSKIKSLAPGKTDMTSFFSLTKGRATIEVDLTDLPDQCSGEGISVEIVSAQSTDPIGCGDPDSNTGPAQYLRCNVNVNGGKYYVRVDNTTNCPVRYRTICRDGDEESGD